MPGKCKFREDWMTNNKDIAKWLRPVEDDKFKAFCIFCKSKFDVSHSGFASIAIHKKGKKHQELANALLSGKQTTIGFKAPSSFPVVSQSLPSESSHQPKYGPENSDCPSTSVASKPINLSAYIANESVLRAEIIWALNKVICHASSRHTSQASDLFSEMFPDSAIAQKFKMHKDKLGYVVTYGLGPHFQDRLCQDLSKCDYYCVSLDESLNKVSQKGQMDVIVRYWDSAVNQVATRYLTSTFLGHSTAVDLLTAFTHTMSELGLSIKKILQISTDGPNVNLKFLSDFQFLMKSEQDSEEAKLMSTGTCCLHIVHGAYKTALAKSGWDLNGFLRSLYFLFKDFPSRRADYTFHSGSTLFPLKLCSIRWLENGKVIERAIKIIPFVKKYVEALKSKPPASNNFQVVRSFLQDELLLAKLMFLQSVAIELEPFLRKFQSDQPLLPFLYVECYTMMRCIADRFIVKDVMKSVKNAIQLIALEVKKNTNQLNVGAMNVGFGVATICKGIKDSVILSFRCECKNFLLTLYLKLLDKLPLSNRFVKGVSCLSPSVMLGSSIKFNRISIALEEFVAKNQVTCVEADSIKKTYSAICENPDIKEKLKLFDWNHHRLDVFLITAINEIHLNATGINMSAFLIFCQKFFCMFHGNAAVERGFSINKECLIENMLEESLIAQRCVQSAISTSGGVLSVTISKSMIMAVKNASSKRREALKEKMKQDNKKANEIKSVVEKVKELQHKKRKLIQQAEEETHALDLEISEMQKKIKFV